MKFWLSILTLLLCGCMTDNTLTTTTQVQKNVYNMAQLRMGMTQEEFYQIMRYPFHEREIVTDEGCYDVWFYLTSPTILDQGNYTERNFTPFIFKDGILIAKGYQSYHSLLRRCEASKPPASAEEPVNPESQEMENSLAPEQAEPATPPKTSFLFLKLISDANKGQKQPQVDENQMPGKPNSLKPTGPGGGAPLTPNSSSKGQKEQLPGKPSSDKPIKPGTSGPKQPKNELPGKAGEKPVGPAGSAPLSPKDSQQQEGGAPKDEENQLPGRPSGIKPAQPGAQPAPKKKSQNPSSPIMKLQTQQTTPPKQGQQTPPASPQKQDQQSQPAYPQKQGQQTQPASPQKQDQQSQPAYPHKQGQQTQPASPQKQGQQSQPAYPHKQGQQTQPASPQKQGQQSQPLSPQKQGEQTKPVESQKSKTKQKPLSMSCTRRVDPGAARTVNPAVNEESKQTPPANEGSEQPHNPTPLNPDDQRRLDEANEQNFNDW